VSQLILNNIDPSLLEKLKRRAANHQRSLEEELKAILQEAIEVEQAAKMKAFRDQAYQMRQALSGRVHTDSAELVREDRDSLCEAPKGR
jgi:plasmid stability protein